MTFPFSYHATVKLLAGDTRAIGAAVTVALCGHWDHTGPCRWPHLTTVEPATLEPTTVDPITPEPATLEPTAIEASVRMVSVRMVSVRVAYGCAAEERAEVEALIAGAIRSGRLTGPDGEVSTWRVDEA